MKLKVKYTSTRKFMVTLTEPIFGNLKDEIRKFVENTYGENVREPLTLSLNGADPIQGLDSDQLEAIGIVRGDMVTIINPVEGAEGGGERMEVEREREREKESGNNSKKSKFGEKKSEESEFGEKKSKDGKNKEKKSKESEIKEHPKYLIDSRDGMIPMKIFELFSRLQPTSKSQALNLLIHLAIMECGFNLADRGGVGGAEIQSKPEKIQSEPVKSENNQSEVEKSGEIQFKPKKTGEKSGEIQSKPEKSGEIQLEPPPNWRDPVCTVQYRSNNFVDFNWTLVLVTMGPFKQILASFPGQETEISVKLDTRDYFRGSEGAREGEGEKSPVKQKCGLLSGCVQGSELHRVHGLARTVRDSVIYRVQVCAHELLGVPAPWHMVGLPNELLMKIAAFLDYRDVIALRGTCQRLKTAMDDNKLWHKLYARDFNSLYEDIDKTTHVDWKARYQEAVRRRKEWQKLEDDGMEYVIPGIYPNTPPIPQPYPGNIPQPYPGIPNPNYPNRPPNYPNPNPYFDPDSPYFGGEVPQYPGILPDLPDMPGPNPLGPIGPLGPRRPGPNPFGPNNPFGPSNMFPRPRNPRGPRFDFF